VKVYESGQPRQLGLIVVGIAVAWLAVLGLTRGWAVWRHSVATHNLAAARSDMQHLRVPAAYKPFTKDCQWYRCYRIDAPSHEVAPTVRSVLVSTGATAADLGRIVTRVTGLSLSGASLLNGCHTIDTASSGALTTCTFAGYLHREAVDVFLHPYFAPGAAGHQSIKHISEVDVAFDGPGPGIAQ
jgi:hypothetical protein